MYGQTADCYRPGILGWLGGIGEGVALSLSFKSSIWSLRTAFSAESWVQFIVDICERWDSSSSLACHSLFYKKNSSIWNKTVGTVRQPLTNATYSYLTMELTAVSHWFSLACVAIKVCVNSSTSLPLYTNQLYIRIKQYRMELWEKYWCTKQPTRENETRNEQDDKSYAKYGSKQKKQQKLNEIQ